MAGVAHLVEEAQMGRLEPVELVRGELRGPWTAK
jgi:hypothetical protein